MRFGGLKDLLKALPAAGQGAMQGIEMRHKWDQAAADAAYKKSQLEHLNKKAEQDALQNQADLYGKGLVVQDGKTMFDPELLDAGSNASRARARLAEIKAMESPQRGTVSMRAGDVFAMQGRQVPQGMDPNTPIYSGFVNAFQQPKEVEHAPDQAVRDLEKKLGAPSGSFGRMTAKDYAGKLTFLKGQQGTQERYEGTKNLDVLKNLKPEIKENEMIDQTMSFYDELESGIDAFNPSGAEYYVLKAKSKAASFDPGALLGGKPLVFKDLSPQESDRLAYYARLDTDAIKSMFEAGGKQLTPTEKSELGKLSIVSTDTKQTIRAKLVGLRAWLDKKKASNLSIMEQLSGATPGGSTLNPSQKRAIVSKGPTGTDLPDARSKGEKPKQGSVKDSLNAMSDEDLLKAYNNFKKAKGGK